VPAQRKRARSGVCLPATLAQAAVIKGGLLEGRDVGHGAFCWAGVWYVVRERNYRANAARTVQSRAGTCEGLSVA